MLISGNSGSPSRSPGSITRYYRSFSNKVTLSKGSRYIQEQSLCETMACSVVQACDPLGATAVQENFEDLFFLDHVEDKIDNILGDDWIQSVPVRNKDIKAKLFDEKEEFLRLFGIQMDLDSYPADTSNIYDKPEPVGNEQLSSYLKLW
eukprot:766816-Hanusia_phi.AAC.3